MGKIKHITKIKNLIKEMTVFRASDIERITQDKNYTHLLLHNLMKKKEIFRIKKGWYSTIENPVLSVFCFRPAYLGLQSALSLHNIWEQETNPVIMTNKKVRRGVREIFGNNVIIRHIPPKYFFGFDFIDSEDYSLPVSDLEKTLIDLLYFKQKTDKELLEILKRKTDKKKIELYLKEYPTEFRRKIERIM